MASVYRQMLRLYGAHYGSAVRLECGQLVSLVKIQIRKVRNDTATGGSAMHTGSLLGFVPLAFFFRIGRNRKRITTLRLGGIRWQNCKLCRKPIWRTSQFRRVRPI